jgi:hypothetical protein
MRIERNRTKTETPNASSVLIADWATRVMDLWEDSREPQPSVPEATPELGAACRVRDDLNNRLGRTHEDSAPCGERTMQVLHDADALFRLFTTESSTAQSLSSHNHYARRSEWWWRRLPRQRFAAVAA